MPSHRRQTDPCLTCGAFLLFAIGVWLTAPMVFSTIWNRSSKPTRYNANGTQLPPLVGCPSNRFMRIQGAAIQIIENEDIPYSPRCFNLPQLTHRYRSQCFQTVKEKCTPLAAALGCYHPGECPKYHTRHSIFLNTHDNRNGKTVTSQAVCCW